MHPYFILFYILAHSNFSNPTTSIITYSQMKPQRPSPGLTSALESRSEHSRSQTGISNPKTLKVKNDYFPLSCFQLTCSLLWLMPSPLLPIFTYTLSSPDGLTPASFPLSISSLLSLLMPHISYHHPHLSQGHWPSLLLVSIFLSFSPLVKMIYFLKSTSDHT